MAKCKFSKAFRSINVAVQSSRNGTPCCTLLGKTDAGHEIVVENLRPVPGVISCRGEITRPNTIEFHPSNPNDKSVKPLRWQCQGIPLSGVRCPGDRQTIQRANLRAVNGAGSHQQTINATVEVAFNSGTIQLAVGPIDVAP
jgi:hypothetical protein